MKFAFLCFEITTLIVFCQANTLRSLFDSTKLLDSLQKHHQARDTQQALCGVTCLLDSDCRKFADGRFCQNGQCVLKLVDGARCVSSDQCQTESSCINGICGIRRESGCPCTVNAQCQSNSNCTSDVCSFVTVKSQTTRVCIQNSNCRSNICANGRCAPVPNGNPCGINGIQVPDCNSNSFCNITNSQLFTGICVPLGNIGDSCSNSNQCLSNLFCDTVSRTCNTRLSLGQPCSFSDQCISTAFCSTNQNPSVCTLLKNDGGSCSNSEECVGSLSFCTNGTCFGYGSRNIGQSCRFDPFGQNNCKNFAACVNGICSNSINPNGVCTQNGDCDRQTCDCGVPNAGEKTCGGIDIVLTSSLGSCQPLIDAFELCFLQNNCQTEENCPNCQTQAANLLCGCLCDPINQYFGNDLTNVAGLDVKFFAATGSCRDRSSVEFPNSCSGTKENWSTVRKLCNASSNSALKNTELNFSLLIVFLFFAINFVNVLIF